MTILLPNPAPIKPMSRRKRSAKTKSLEAKPSKSLAMHGVNFFALVLGLTAASLIFFLVWTFITSSPGEYEKGDDYDRLYIQATESSVDEFNTLWNSSDLAQKLQIFRSLNDIIPTTSGDRRVLMHRRRVWVIDRLIDNAKRELRMELLEAKLDSCQQLLDLCLEWERDPTDDRFELKKLANQLVSDREPSLAIQGRVALIRMEAKEPSKVRQTAKKIQQLVDEFPDDLFVSSSLKTMIEGLVSSPKTRPVGLQLVAAIDQTIDRTRFVEKTDLSNVLQDFRDWKVLGNAGFFEAWESRSFSGDTGCLLLKKTAVELAQDTSAGPEIVQRILEIGAWFEQTNEYDYALSIYQQLQQESESYELPSVRRRAAQLGAQGVTRCQSIDQLIKLDGITLQGESLDTIPLEGRSVVLIFFSLEDSGALEGVKMLYANRDDWSLPTVSVITICTDDREGNAFNRSRLVELDEQLQGWTMCIRDQQNRLPLFDQCPSQQRFRIALLNSQHRMVDAAVLPTDLRSAVHYLTTSDR